MIDNFEGMAFEAVRFDVAAKLNQLNKGFENNLFNADKMFAGVSPELIGNVARWLDVPPERITEQLVSNIYDAAKNMVDGIIIDGKHGLGLLEIASWKIHPDFVFQGLKQHAGFAAEVIGVTKENMRYIIDKSPIRAFRADDLPELFKKNDQFVDKVRINIKTNEIIERIQVKFVGKNGAECLARLRSKAFDKFFDGKVDKIEIPKDFYKEIKENNLIGQTREKLTRQLEKVQGVKNDVAEKIQAKLERLDKIEAMLEESTVTSDEAQYAVKHPKRYAAKLFAKNVVHASNKAGLESAGFAAVISGGISVVDNIQKYMKGEVTSKEAIEDIAKDTGKAGLIGYGTGFITTAIAQSLEQSGHILIRSVGNSQAVGAAVALGIESYDSIVDYAQGIIDLNELAYDLGESAAGVAGSVAGGMAAGAALGSIVPGAGTLVGAGVGLVGSMVGYTVGKEAFDLTVEAGKNMADFTKDRLDELGPEKTAMVVGGVMAGGVVGGLVSYAIATEAYVSILEAGIEGAEVLADKALEAAYSTIQLANEFLPDRVDIIIAAMNLFAKAAGIDAQINIEWKNIEDIVNVTPIY